MDEPATGVRSPLCTDEMGETARRRLRACENARFVIVNAPGRAHFLAQNVMWQQLERRLQ